MRHFFRSSTPSWQVQACLLQRNDKEEHLNSLSLGYGYGGSQGRPDSVLEKKEVVIKAPMTFKSDEEEIKEEENQAVFEVEKERSDAEKTKYGT